MDAEDLLVSEASTGFGRFVGAPSSSDFDPSGDEAASSTLDLREDVIGNALLDSLKCDSALPTPRLDLEELSRGELRNPRAIES